MAKALETILPDFTPSALQQAAIARIREYKKELASYGMYVRTAMELEFMVQDDMGFLIPGTLDLDKSLSYLRDKEDLPYIENIVLEGEIGRRKKRPDLATQYEINISDDAVNTPKQLAPEKIAAVAERIKTQSLRNMLMSTTCLTPRAARHPIAIFPTLVPRPHADAAEGDIFHNTETSSLHVNISLCDSEGRNLFARSDRLLDHCVRALVDLQNNAALPMLPHEESFKRINANNSAPGGIGVRHGKRFNGKRHTSVNIRSHHSGDDPSTPSQEQIRIENRLPGSDADPFVTMAVTMAAMVDAVRKHVHKTPDPQNQKVRLKIDDKEKEPFPIHEFPKTHDGLIKKYQAAAHIRELLGTRLYDAILDEYRAERFSLAH